MTEHDEAPKRGSGDVENRLARHGHVSYLEIPAIDTEQSAAFYERSSAGTFAAAIPGIPA